MKYLLIVVITLLGIKSLECTSTSCTRRAKSVILNLGATRNDDLWVVTSQNKSTSVKSTVPGGIYSDLDAAGIFSTPIYWGHNDADTRWVGRTNWTFSRSFNVSKGLLSRLRIVLVCNGLDTVANVFINEVSVGKSDNMFVRYIYDIKEYLKLGKNTIEIEFQSPVEYAEKEWYAQKINYPVGPSKLVPQFHGENHANHIRKMQASFSWDWGPSYPSSGIWKDIYIEAYDLATIRDTLVFITPNTTKPDETDNTSWNITVRVYFEVLASKEETGLIVLCTRLYLNASKAVTVFKNILIQPNRSTEAFEDVTLNVSGSDVKLWWPNGYGEQPLYDLKVSFNKSREQNLRIGFRTVELVQDFINELSKPQGREFYFRVNGQPIYAKGSNFIPIHVLPERVTPKMTRWILESAKETHTNMIRVWGGGIYESDLFYNLADEMGILIWQDFMFACGMYPTTPHFIATVKREVETQVKRLQYHPSIALWAGNNENEVALRGNWYETASNFSLYKSDYIKLYIDTVMKELLRLDPSREFLPSSPTNGKESEEEGWVAKNPYSPLYGDSHIYNYFADGWDWETFPYTRFASEYGYQSWPHPQTLLTASDNQDWYWGSDMISYRQHHPNGQNEILYQISTHLPVPGNHSTLEAFSYVLYLIQITQSMSIKTETETYRRMQGILEPNGEGHNMGALYWQLNDIWQGASWASIEITGRWKMLHYYARNFFAPVLASPYQIDNKDIIVTLVSDDTKQFSGSLRVRLFQLNSMIPVKDYQVPVDAAPLSAKEVYTVHSPDDVCNNNSMSICLLYLTLPGTPDNFLFLQYPKDISNIGDPKIQILKVSSSSDGKTFTFTLKTEAIAPFVFLNMLNNDILGWFSDNGFIMVEPLKTLTFTSKSKLSMIDFQNNIDILTLHDFYRS